MCNFCGKPAPQTWTVCCPGGLQICFICSIRNPNFCEGLLCDVCQRQLGYYMYNRLKVQIEDHYRCNSFPPPSPSRPKFPQRPQVNQNYYQHHQQFYPSYCYTPQNSGRQGNQMNYFNKMPNTVRKQMGKFQGNYENYQGRSSQNRMDIENKEAETVDNFFKSSRKIMSNKSQVVQNYEEMDLEKTLCQRLRTEKSNDEHVQHSQNQNYINPNISFNHTRDPNQQFADQTTESESNYSKNTQYSQPSNRMQKSRSSIGMNPLLQRNN